MSHAEYFFFIMSNYCGVLVISMKTNGNEDLKHFISCTLVPALSLQSELDESFVSNQLHIHK